MLKRFKRGHKDCLLNGTTLRRDEVLLVSSLVSQARLARDKHAAETRGMGFRLLDMQATSKRRTRALHTRTDSGVLSNPLKLPVLAACALAVHAFSWRVTDGYCVYLSSLNGRASFNRLMSRFVRIFIPHFV